MAKVLIVGAGAAGLMAAGAAVRQGHQVTVLEHMDKPAQKILVTGKGRCNVTNDCTAEEFLHHVRTNPRFLFSSLGAFPPAKTMELFESLGVELKVERGRRVFPVSDKAEEIRQALLRYAQDAELVHDGARKLLLEELPPEAETEAAGESDTQQGQAEKNHAAAMRALRESLEAKGFRADLLAQIADEDLADLQGCEILNVRLVDYDEAQNGERSSKMQGSIIYVQTAGVEAKAFFLYAYLDEGIRKPHSWIADGASLLSNHEWDGAYGGRVFCERGGKLLTAVPQVEKETIVTPWIGESTMTRAYLKARYSYPLFSRNQRGYLYVWMRDARYAYGMNAEVYACRPGIQLPYRELPPVDRSGALSFGSAPKERILSLYTSYNVFDELAPYVDDVEALFQELGIGTE